MGHVGAGGAQKLRLGLVRVDAVGHDRARSQQPKVVVGVAVAARPRAQLLDPAAFRRVLGQVALDGKVLLAGDVGELGHELVGDARREARRDDGRGVVIAVGNVGKPAARVGGGLGGVLLEVLATVAVHVHLAHVRGESRGLELVHEQLGCLDVHRAKDHGTRRGAAAQVAREDVVGALGVGGVGVVGLLGKRVGVEPVQKL